MSDEEKRPYGTQAEAREVLRPVQMQLPQQDIHARRADSPWGVGSSSYACSPEIVQKHVQDLLPDAKPWLRSAFDKCMSVSLDGATTYAQCVVNHFEAINLREVRAFQHAHRTCFDEHPGLCASDPSCTSILAFHAQIAKALSTLATGRDNVDGVALYLFAGYRRLRDAEAAGRRIDDVSITADTFDVAFVADQPDRRRKLRTWTRCRFVGGSEFNCPQHVALINTDRQVLAECWSYKWAKRLRDVAKYYWIHQLEYVDLETEIHVVKAAQQRQN